LNKKLVFVIYVAVFLLFWNVLDFLYATFIAKSSYHFAAGTDLLVPVVAACVSGYLFYLRKK